MSAFLKTQKPTSEQVIASMFDRIAPRYDLLNKLLSFRQDLRWRRHLVKMIPYRPEGTFVDVATGTGDVILAASKVRKEYSRFVGVDISQQMLAKAKEKLRSTPLEKADDIEFQLMSAESLQFADKSCDCLSIAFGLRNVVHKEHAISEFFRVLKPNGYLLILEFFKPSNSFVSFAFQLYFHYILPFIGGLLSDKAAYKYLPESVAGFTNVAGMQKQLLAQGFIVEESRRYLFGGCSLLMARRSI